MSQLASLGHRRQLSGIVVSDKMTKTVIVRIDRVLTHRKYGKQYAVSRRLSADDATGQYHVGDRVLIEETRPMSRTKRWRVLRTLT